MSFRTRLLLTFVGLVSLPIAFLAIGVRTEMTRRVSREYEERVRSLATLIAADLERQGDAIVTRLATLESALRNDNRFRLAAIAGDNAERPYLLDWAKPAMELAGLSLLKLHDQEGRVLSSGSFRNDYGRLEPAFLASLAELGDQPALIQARAPEGSYLALVRSETFAIGEREFSLAGGVTVDRRFLARLAGGGGLQVSLLFPGGGFSSDAAIDQRLSAQATPFADRIVDELELPIVQTVSDGASETSVARIVVTQTLDSLVALEHSVATWLFRAVALIGALTLLVAALLTSLISRPLSTLARKTADLDLDHLDVDFSSTRKDELGALSRMLASMTTRLGASATQLRAAERRAAVGDLARQVNHDIKNALTPLRNVVRHMTEVASRDPDQLAGVLADRQATLDSSMDYLQTLAGRYARLSPTAQKVRCDVNVLIEQIVRDTACQDGVDFRTKLEPVPRVWADPLSLRRVLENLIANAVESLDQEPRRITVASSSVDHQIDGEQIRIAVTDTGRGMSAEERRRIFEDFFTTKDQGTGLGLSIVRRLVLDLGGTLRVESQPGRGSCFVVEVPGIRPDGRGETR